MLDRDHYLTPSRALEQGIIDKVVCAREKPVAPLTA